MTVPLPLPGQHPTARELALGRFVVPLGSAARTDNAAAGEIHAYESGATIVLQISTATPGTWRSVTLT